MNNQKSAASMVKGAGPAVTKAYNLHGNLIGPRKKDGDGCIKKRMCTETAVSFF